MQDLWYEGYGAGLSGCNWVSAVAGRFLTQWERIALYDGWKTAIEDKATWPKDMQEQYISEAEMSTIPL